MRLLLLGVAFCLGVVRAGPWPPVSTQPEQVHLSYGIEASEMVVSWVTQHATNLSMVEYGTNGLSLSANGTMKEFMDGGRQRRIMYMHKVVLKNLKPGTTYVYHCGSPSLGWSDLFFFTAMNTSTEWRPRLAVFGDMGNDMAKSLTRLQEESQKGLLDAVLHVGDFAYDMDTDNARVGDAFMRQIEPVAAYVPYMTCPGNHEHAYNFSNYKNRFNMPGGDGQGLFYSFNIGPAHIIGFSTEVFYFTKYGMHLIGNQRRWLEQDLKKANANRASQPWVITMGHRPMYCSNSDKDDCTYFESLVRQGLEDLFYKYGVDLEFWAHEHSYERLWPVYNRTVCNGSSSPYTNPKAPVHITTGSAGCREHHDAFLPFKPAWSAYRNNDYGYTRMHLHNATHIYLEQVSDDQGGAIVDNLWIIKDKHGPGLYDCTNGQKNNILNTLKKIKHPKSEEKETTNEVNKFSYYINNRT